jgi:hypothetical protein
MNEREVEFMKHRHLIFLVLAMLTACSSEPPLDRAIPGLTHDDVQYALADKDMLTSGKRDAQGLISSSFKAYRGGVDYLVNAYGREGGKVDSVWVRLEANPAIGDVLDELPFFRDIAAMTYDDCDPDRTLRWLTENYSSIESRLIVGPAEFTLRAPSAYMRELTLRRAR